MSRLPGDGGRSGHESIRGDAQTLRGIYSEAAQPVIPGDNAMDPRLMLPPVVDSKQDVGSHNVVSPDPQPAHARVPVQPPRRVGSLRAPVPHWRSRVTSQFHKRRQRPEDIRKLVQRRSRQLGPLVSVKIPDLPRLGHLDDVRGLSRHQRKAIAHVRDALRRDKVASSQHRPAMDGSPHRPRSLVILPSLDSSTPKSAGTQPDSTEEKTAQQVSGVTLGVSARKALLKNASSLLSSRADELYRVERVEEVDLPLEIFDTDLDQDRTGDEWMAFGARYGGRGLPAKSRYYVAGEWLWCACRVLGYNADSRKFTVKFDGVVCDPQPGTEPQEVQDTPAEQPSEESQADGAQDGEQEVDEQVTTVPRAIKHVNRLGVMFDDEDCDAFLARLSKCERLRADAVLATRHRKFISAQPDNLSAINQSALHGIMTRVVNRLESFVISNESIVEQLLEEVRNDYKFSMKQAVLYFLQRDPEVKKHILSLGLPVAPEAPAVAESAVISVDYASLSPALSDQDINDYQYCRLGLLLRPVQQLHYSVHNATVNVVRGVFQSFGVLRRGCLFLRVDVQFKHDAVRDASALSVFTEELQHAQIATQHVPEEKGDSSMVGPSPLQMGPPLRCPIALYDYSDEQDHHFNLLVQKLNSDWRTYVVNLIRDQLHESFRLFVNVQEAYDNSPLQQFLRMLGFMLRYQLAHMTERSLHMFASFFEQYCLEDHERKATVKFARVLAAKTNNAKQHLTVKSDAGDGKSGERPRERVAAEVIHSSPRRLDAAQTLLEPYINGFGSGDLDPTDELKNTHVGGLSENSRLILQALPTDVSAASMHFQPLFSFKLTYREGNVVYVPSLSSISTVLSQLCRVPEKLQQQISDIEHEIVPLLALTARPLCSPETVPRVFQEAERTRTDILAIVEDNLYYPRALQILYADVAAMVPADLPKYVETWFATRTKSAQKAAKILDESGNSNANQNNQGSNSSWSSWFAQKNAAGGGESAQKEAKPERDHRKPRHFLESVHTLEETRDCIQRFRDAILHVHTATGSQVTFKMLLIDCSACKDLIIEALERVTSAMLARVAKEVHTLCSDMKADFDEMTSYLERKCTDVLALAELKDRIASLENKEIPLLREEIQIASDKAAMLDHFGFRRSREDFNLLWEVKQFPRLLIGAIEDRKMNLERDNAQFESDLEREKEELQAALITFSKKVDEFTRFGVGSASDMDTYATEVDNLKKKLDEADQTVRSFARRNALFEITDGDEEMFRTELTALRTRFNPLYQLWSTTSAFQANHGTWINGAFTELDADDIEKHVLEWYRLMFRLEKEFLAKNLPCPSQVARAMKQKIAEFKDHIPIIRWLRKPGLKPRHWEQISQKLDPDRPMFTAEELTLAQLLSIERLSTHRKWIEDLCVSASKEYALEQVLDGMKREWNYIRMDLVPYKNTRAYYLKGSEEIRTLLDEQLLKTQAMRASEYIKPIEAKTLMWENHLKMMSAIIEEWLKCQQTWLYLEPIFASDDIMRQMPRQGRIFGVVNRSWRKVMSQAYKQPNLYEFVLQDSENVLATFKQCNEMLDQIGSELNAYLDTKRRAFPRFYFLSNDELLSILSQTKNVLAVQPHLPKCFDGMYELEFQLIPGTGPDADQDDASGGEGEDGMDQTDLLSPPGAPKPRSSINIDTGEQDETQDAAKNLAEYLIVGMHSRKGEYVPFIEIIDPNEGTKRGNVELWITDVERVMRESLHAYTRSAINAYTKRPRTEWVLKEYGQMVLAVSQTIWTQEVTVALTKYHDKGLKQYLGLLDKQLSDLVELVRQPLSSIHRLTLGALVVLDVHARDVVADMFKLGVREVSDFEWLTQMRYYWDASLGQARLQPDECPVVLDYGSVPDGSLIVKQLQTTLEYGFEYLGNMSRLVITPLTDRCYRTLMGAVHLHLGGAPEGPAGTGKTETVKDLAKCVALRCVVFNGSDQLTHKAMSKFFKGLASSGAWCCFDEFNRIDLEVLSVIAQQIYCIQAAIIEDKHEFLFDGQNLPLVHTCSVFITMNPGYAGRAELPDNLKSLFRTVAMMIPDYAMIAEIDLYSKGYHEARSLARKVVACLRLSSEQLSSQYHYDFGMRNVKSILSAAGRLKQACPGEPEALLCLRAICDCNVPKFVSQDLPLFFSIVQDLFPTVAKDRESNDETAMVLRKYITWSLKQLNLQPCTQFVHKVVQLHDTINVRHGLMLIGEPNSGKSTAVRVLKHALTRFARDLDLSASNPGRTFEAVTDSRQPTDPHNDEKLSESQQEEAKTEEGVANSTDPEGASGVLGNPEISDGEGDSNNAYEIDTQPPVRVESAAKQRRSPDDGVLTRLTRQQIAHFQYVRPVDVSYLNPKSISAQDLYGHEDVSTKEWHDGVLPTVMRRCVREELEARGAVVVSQVGEEGCDSADNDESKAASESPQPPPQQSSAKKSGGGQAAATRLKWVVFDGPVDALWIEDMNTVLDDNKKLCLASGEQIGVLPGMSMMFEVQSLVYASPATVSRCGMVYMEPHAIGWRPLVLSWLNKLPKQLQAHYDHLLCLFDWLVPPCLYVALNSITNVLAVSEMGFVANLLQLMDAMCALVMRRIQSIHAKEAAEREAKAKQARESKRKSRRAGGTGGSDSKRSGWGGNGISLMNSVDWKEYLENLFLFAVVWSFGSSTDTAGRRHFSKFFKTFVSGGFKEQELARAVESAKAEEKRGGHTRGTSVTFSDKTLPADLELDSSVLSRVARMPMPERIGSAEASVFDLVFDENKNEWVSWMESQQEFTIPKGAQFHDIIVPTATLIRSSWLNQVLIEANHHIMLCGVTGTGKSISARHKLMYGLDKTAYTSLVVTFSARTTATSVQNVIESKLDRRRAGVLGPPPPQRCVIFVDDLSMPAVEKYGAQPPIEFLRQWMDYHGWFDQKTQEFMLVEDIQFLAAMPPPGGGRNPVSQRYLRHFFDLCLVPYSAESLQYVFTTIVKHFFSQLSLDVRQQSNTLVEATIELFESVQAQMKPTPAKAHYTFNLRDMSKIIQGVTSAHASALKSRVAAVRLWAHECQRAFGDRFINQADHDVLDGLMATVCRNNFNVDYKEDILRGANSLLFCDFSDPNLLHVGRPYVECSDINVARKAIESYLREYNEMEPTPMDLVFFEEAIHHISRITRIIRQPYGNALLVGLGGSGRQSLTKLAAFISEYQLFQIKPSRDYNQDSWHDDLREVLTVAGGTNKPVVFLLTDAQLTAADVASSGGMVDPMAAGDSFLEDVNNILNNGEVPNLFPEDQLLPLIEQMMPDARRAGRADSNSSIFQFFVERCKHNMHIVMCFSPVSGGGSSSFGPSSAEGMGPLFRRRLRMFPSLINCTTVDWFHPWPLEALNSVGSYMLQNETSSIPKNVLDGVVQVCVDMQTRVANLSKLYLQQERRHNYVTPSSFLELIRLFLYLYERTRDVVVSAQQKYTKGLGKLLEAEEQTNDMEAKLKVLRLELYERSGETKELMKTIRQRTAQVDKTKKIVTQEEEQCNLQAEEAKRIKDACERQVEAAMPALREAKANLKVLKRSHLDELRANNNPTQGVVLAVESIMIMLDEAPEKTGPVGQKKLNYWEPAKKRVLNSKLMNRLLNYDGENIPTHIINKVRTYVRNPDFRPDRIAHSSIAAESFCKWVISMEAFDRVIKEVRPKQLKYEEAQKKMAAAFHELSEKKKQLAEVRAYLFKLQEEFRQVNEQKEDLARQVAQCEGRLERAATLIGGLANAKTRWREKAAQLGADLEHIVGNVLVASGMVAYLGVFTSKYRDMAISAWLGKLKTLHIPCAEDFKLSKVLGDPLVIRKWHIQQLPRDDFSTDNAIILSHSMRWGLMIDPQEQASKWIRNKESKSALMAVTRALDASKTNTGGRHSEKKQAPIPELVVLKQTDDRFLQNLCMAVERGFPVLIENIQESLDPALDSLLLRQTFPEGQRLGIRIAGETLTYHPRFRLYLTTKLPNPHYTPEVTCKVTLVNFMITQDGLEDQMLGTVVSQEEPEWEQTRSELIVKNAENKAKLNVIEGEMLHHLGQSAGMIVDNDDLIQALQVSKQTAKQIEDKMAESQQTEANINKIRAEYQPVAVNSANLFFCVQDLAKVDPMYQNSLSWFNNLFMRAIRDAPQSKDVDGRIAAIDRTFTYLLYINICRSIFAKHKLLFSFMLLVRVMRANNAIDETEFRFLLTGGIATGATLKQNPTSQGGGGWLSDAQWALLVRAASQVTAFVQLEDHFIQNMDRWKTFKDAADPYTTPLPAPFDALSPIQRMLLVRIFHPDKLTEFVRRVIAGRLGKEFIDPPLLDIEAAFADSSCTKPLIFVLSPGVDPVKDIVQFGVLRGYTPPTRLLNVSLGQGQGPVAEAAISAAVDKGTWVLLQNCHLAASWMPTLQRLVDNISPQTTNVNFRLWLTSAPTPAFPVSVLQNGVKMTNEAPQGIRANLSKAFREYSDEWVGACAQPEVLRKLLFGLSFFHAVVLERRTFGAIGWNICYEFTQSDLDISNTQLRMLLDLYAPKQEVPFTALKYLIGELNYGGRVTDSWDRRIIHGILQDCMKEEVLQEVAEVVEVTSEDDNMGGGSTRTETKTKMRGYAFDGKQVYRMLEEGSTCSDYRRYIAGLPQEDNQDIFGLHENAVITCSIQKGQELLQQVLRLQPQTRTEQSSDDDQKEGEGVEEEEEEKQDGAAGGSDVGAIAKGIENRLPSLFDLAAAKKKFPVVYEESMNTVLVQELVRYNRLLSVMKDTLQQVQKALRGEVVFSQQLETVAGSLYNNQVPSVWEMYGYPSLKPLGAWVQDFLMRLTFLQRWLTEGAPGVFWISGFFFTQAFLTGILQNFARTHQTPIDLIDFSFKVHPNVPTTEWEFKKPEDGAYVFGMYLQGARWNAEQKVLDDPKLGELFATMPVVHLLPVQRSEKKPAADGVHVYRCPLYKTSARAGTLSTTGHSTNFVLAFELPSKQTEDHWVKRGAALLTQLDT